MTDVRCWQPRSHDAHDWTDELSGGRVVHCDGRPFQARATSPDAPPVPAIWKEGGPASCDHGASRDAPRPDDSDQRQGGAALPEALRDFLALPEVRISSDERRCAVVIEMPSYLARSLADLAPDPLQVRLAAQLVEAAEMDAADARLDLLREVAG